MWPISRWKQSRSPPETYLSHEQLLRWSRRALGPVFTQKKSNKNIKDMNMLYDKDCPSNCKCLTCKSSIMNEVLQRNDAKLWITFERRLEVRHLCLKIVQEPINYRTYQIPRGRKEFLAQCAVTINYRSK